LIRDWLVQAVLKNIEIVVLWDVEEKSIKLNFNGSYAKPDSQENGEW
jgi:hypothetical protein